MWLLLLYRYSIGITLCITFFLEYQRACLRVGGVRERMDTEKDWQGEGCNEGL